PDFDHETGDIKASYGPFFSPLFSFLFFPFSPFPSLLFLPPLFFSFFPSLLSLFPLSLPPSFFFPSFSLFPFPLFSFSLPLFL
ncbi:hypothetical protein ACXWRS_11345, partial [Streptococcus pyogenes]